MECIFCKIIAKQIPNHTVWEDDHVLAFLDIFPCSKGHTVVVPKKHATSIFDLSTEDFDLVAHGLRAAAGRVEARLRPDGMNIAINNGEAAGQAVPHMHWHILPRFKGDGGGNAHSIIKSKEKIDVAEIAKLFK